MQARIDAQLGVGDVLGCHRPRMLDDHTLEVVGGGHAAAHLVIDRHESRQVGIFVGRRRGQPVPCGQFGGGRMADRPFQVDVQLREPFRQRNAYAPRDRRCEAFAGRS